MEPKEEKKRKRRKVEGPSDKPDKISVKVPKRKAQKGRAQLNGIRIRLSIRRSLTS